MITTLLWDLSEVLIAGLVGVEQTLAPQINRPPQAILDGLGHEPLRTLCCNKITASEYYRRVINKNNWPISATRLNSAITEHFHTTIPDGISLLKKLSSQYQCILVSDHGEEWTRYIRTIHGFFHCFEHCVFSWQIGTIKRNPDFFGTVLSRYKLHPEQCVLIDDSEKNIHTAHKLHMQGVKFTDARAAEITLNNLLLS